MPIYFDLISWTFDVCLAADGFRHGRLFACREGAGGWGDVAILQYCNVAMLPCCNGAGNGTAATGRRWLARLHQPWGGWMEMWLAALTIRMKHASSTCALHSNVKIRTRSVNEFYDTCSWSTHCHCQLREQHELTGCIFTSKLAMWCTYCRCGKLHTHRKPSMGLIFHARPDATICCALILEIEWIGFFLFLPPAQDIMWVERGGGRRCRWRGGGSWCSSAASSWWYVSTGWDTGCWRHTRGGSDVNRPWRHAAWRTGCAALIDAVVADGRLDDPTRFDGDFRMLRTPLIPP